MSSDAARRGYRSQDPLSAHRMMELGLPPRRARPGPRVCGPGWAGPSAPSRGLGSSAALIADARPPRCPLSARPESCPWARRSSPRMR